MTSPAKQSPAAKVPQSSSSRTAKSSPVEETQPSNMEVTLRLLTRFQRFASDILGVLTLAFAGMTFLALLLPSLTGGLLNWWATGLSVWFGWGSVWVVVVTGLAGFLLLQRRKVENFNVPWGRVFALELAAFAALALLAVIGGTSLDRADAGLDGGRIGWALSFLLGEILAPVGLSASLWRASILSLILVWCLVVGLRLAGPLSAWVEKSAQADDGADFEAEPAVSIAPIQGQGALPTAELKKKRNPLPAEFRKKFTFQPEEDADAERQPPPPRNERLPSLDLLVNEQANRPDERHINLTAGLIEKTLSEFGIPAKVVGFRVGPTVTQFAVEPGFLEKPPANKTEASQTDPNRIEEEARRQKVRVAQIAALSKDLALALSAERLRIEAPVPGRPYVGIEVPNSRSTVVRLRSVLESETFYKTGSPLSIALGRDVSGQPVVADLGRMPHLLIAGTTGSGKSVCIAALTTCLVMNNTPEDLRLVMIDPKMVELVRFNGLPHLFGKVETELERILGVLRWTVAEMDRRYKLLEASHSRNLETYNKKARRRGEAPLPRIVVMVDELADLMMSAPEQTEPTLVRLAQLARAIGIHLVVATQRPSTDVVTGLIKANFPARISFAVASSIDSRVILDTTGAEALLGHGDMLFLPPEAAGPIRSQGVMVSDHEVEKVITYWQRSVPRDQAAPSPWEEMLEQEAMLADRDNLVQQAIEVVRGTQRASASLLQRRLRIGYPRAARLIDELEELGIVGPNQGGGRDREVLVERDESSPAEE